MKFMNFIITYSLIIIWIVVFINIIMIVFGYKYYHYIYRKNMKRSLEYYPFVSILIPAHNEETVIRKTIISLMDFNYPNEKYEIIVINDNSSDNSNKILKKLQNDYSDRNLLVINTDNIQGGKGKSNALNIGFKKSKGSFLVVYDADNTPDKNALIYLVQTLIKDEEAGAVIGKFRCRNKDVNLLTNFINIETIAFQWMAQAGRAQMFDLCTIPGTNFIVRRKIMEDMNGWDTKAITEDTEMSFRIYMMGYKIKFMPHAVTYEQEPQTIPVWFKQRTRWAKGNIYVIFKNFKYILDKNSGVIRFDIIYFTIIYVFFFSASLISDSLFILSLLNLISINIKGYELILWFMALLIYFSSVMLAISMEKAELNLKNMMIIILAYFTYCKLWTIVAIMGFYSYLKDSLLKRETKWYKTERF